MAYLINEKKVERAVRELQEKNLPVTDEAIKSLYIKYGGKVVEDESEVVPVQAPAEVAEVIKEKIKRTKKVK